jgi:hypothetical protein
MTPIKTAKYYFDLSNESDFDNIKSMFTQSSTYCSGTGELFLGVKDIMVMQRSYHNSFKWLVNTVDEIKPGIIVLDFDFEGETQVGEAVDYSGLEYIIIYAGKIQHIDVHRK